MRTTYLVPGARGRSFSLVAGLAVLCLAGTMVGGSSARAAEASAADSELLTTGAGYAQAHGSTRVQKLQRRLRTLGLRPGPVDGRFGPKTNTAVERFQHALGLRVDGIVGPHTRRALRRASAPLLGRGAGYGDHGGSVQVRNLQRRLRELGLRPGPIDGLYGPLTAAAVGRFQRARGLTPDGVAWSRTRRAIARAWRSETGRLARESGKRTPRTGSSHTSSRPAQDNRPARQAVGNLTRTNASANADEPIGLPLLLLSGLLAFTLVAVAAPLASRLIPSPNGAMPRLSATPPRHRAEPSSSDPFEPVVGHAGDAGPALGELEDGDTRVEAVGYVTVTDADERAELELRHQIGALDAACERRGWRLIEVARDVGEGPDTRLHRPGLSHVLERLAGNDGQCLVVAELRRLGSSAAELGRVLGRLRDRGVRLVAVDVDLDTEAPDGRLAADALISVGELDSSRAALGRPAVRDLPALKEHIVAMRSAGMTLQSIADRLNEEGVPTLRGGREWRPSSVQVAAGYRRPRQLSTSRGSHDRGVYQRRTEDG
jgi:peptidoglycan hydrolase-like protein with peptidoglycan-binding domain